VRVAAGSTVLDALEQAACSQAPALAYRFGCRDGRCGLCTIELDGRPRLACRQRAREGAHIGPLQSLPTIADLVVDRAATDAQLRGLLPPAAPVDPVTPSPTWRSLEGCITCLACLDGCPVHAEGGGNPLAFLRLERARTQPGATDAIARQSVAAAAALGLERCATCMGCRCGVGIPLVSAAIAPLLRATQHAASDHER
jgi:succinate dehydrogenase/fumarate reductase-like Fe-S protein